MTLKIVNGGAMPVLLAGFMIVWSLLASSAHAEDTVPLWAYPRQPPQPASATPTPRPAPDPTLRHVPNSTLEVTLAQAGDSHNVPDWHPDDHPPAPDLILHGHPPHLEACGHCHLPNGLGTTIIQAPSLAGLPADYLLQQMADIRSGARKSVIPTYGPARTMAFVIQDADLADLKIAADYFASLAPKPWFRVVETANVPANKISGMMYVPVAGGGFEPLGMRIVELPEDMTRAELRDSASGFVAYVPPGSIRKGEALATTGGKGITVACTSCHGPDLKGLGPVPPLAGRSPSYVVRQLYDIQQGTRAGVWSALMKPVVARLTVPDMVAIASYVASREP